MTVWTQMSHLTPRVTQVGACTGLWLLASWGLACIPPMAVQTDEDVAIDPDAADLTPDLTPDEEQAGADDELRVRFINLSDLDVDVQFHATDVALDDPPNDLIDPQFAVRAELGVFGSGVLLADEAGEFSVDEITLSCTDTTIIGTAGGLYLDPDLGTPLATGQSRVLQVGINFDCGNTIIFTFTGADGQYATEPAFVDFSD